MPRKTKLTTRTLRGALAIGLLLLPVALVAPPAAAACGDPVDVQVDQDACAGVLAVSATGDATGNGCRGLVSCVTISGTGDATNNGAFAACGFNGFGFAGCVAISGTGDARNDAGVVSCGRGFTYLPILYNPGFTGTTYPTAGCVAVSGTGNATNSARDFGGCGHNNGIGCIAVSGAGNAANDNAGAHESCGVADDFAVWSIGCIAISGTGNAQNSGRHESCGSVRDSRAFGSVALGCVAVSGTGQANNNVAGPQGGRNSCGRTRGLSVAVGCLALSGTDDASNTGTSATDWQGTGGPCGYGNNPEVSGGIGIGCLAASVGGTASNRIDGRECATYAGPFGNSEAVWCVALDGSALPAPAAAPLTPTSPVGWILERAVPLDAPASATAATATTNLASVGVPPMAATSVPATAPTSTGMSWWEALLASVAGWFAAFFGGAS